MIWNDDFHARVVGDFVFSKCWAKKNFKMVHPGTGKPNEFRPASNFEAHPNLGWWIMRMWFAQIWCDRSRRISKRWVAKEAFRLSHHFFIILFILGWTHSPSWSRGKLDIGQVTSYTQVIDEKGEVKGYEWALSDTSQHQKRYTGTCRSDRSGKTKAKTRHKKPKRCVSGGMAWHPKACEKWITLWVSHECF